MVLSYLVLEGTVFVALLLLHNVCVVEGMELVGHIIAVYPISHDGHWFAVSHGFQSVSTLLKGPGRHVRVSTCEESSCHKNGYLNHVVVVAVSKQM